MGCASSIEVESPEEVQKRNDRLEELRVSSEASSLGIPPQGALKTLSEDEQRELVDSALADISYFSDWRFGLGNRLYYEDPAPKMLAALEKAHAKFTDYSFDIVVMRVLGLFKVRSKMTLVLCPLISITPWHRNT